MGHQFFSRFKALLHVGNEIEDELAKQVETKKASSQYRKATTSTSSINQVSSYNPYVPSNHHYSANPYATSVQGNVTNN